MIKKSENEMRAEEARLRGLASNDNAPQEIQRQADCAAHALRWVLDHDAGSTSAADVLEAILSAEPAPSVHEEPREHSEGPQGAAEPAPSVHEEPREHSEGPQGAAEPVPA